MDVDKKTSEDFEIHFDGDEAEVNVIECYNAELLTSRTTARLKTKDNMIENYNSETSKFDVSSFNGKFMGLQGTKVKFILSNFLDEVVTSNKTNKNHLISVTYEEITSTEESDIVKIKNSLKDNNKYEVSLDYDENGYINKVIIKNI